MQTDSIHTHDVVVIGGGIAGLSAALAAAKAGLDIAVASKVHPLRSPSGSAGQGVNAALAGTQDSCELHARDTLRVADGLADYDAVEFLCTRAPQVISELEQLGVLFSRRADGLPAQRPLEPGGFPRACYS
ncbi:MAG: FAD-dependent oxidoreductase, partial [candidate division WOR-3 bacterium]